ncbi:Acyltransferase 3 [Cordyceps fumosorosea ARSEF 2679]|uniref:Acyltransferase 3 n=1 Tax=Cordyceps fumosorosea (strain ARSEF 2679) TaxID=1081104 RepID=A0A166YM66_CORFA|nr:Acyltransferase 3 [Cordyceps fumosorosea ARSEF 2679]OAA37053.1 Acyltransferase 3 [Cordyceps fumosorosea ARSEF 2679]
MEWQTSSFTLDSDDGSDGRFLCDAEERGGGGGDDLPYWKAYWKPLRSALDKGNDILTLRPQWTLQPWSRPSNLHKTAYLDGLRGFAALIVYWHHHELWVHNMHRWNQNGIFENSFGYEGKHHFVALPGIRILFSGGHFAVSIFFVLSGYVLSIKGHKLIESNDMHGLVDHLASSIFRRWTRLFLPVLATLIVYATVWHVFGLWVDESSPQRTWFDEMWFLYCEFKNFSYPFKEGGVPWMSYNMHVWSIAAEFKGSLVVFGSLLAFSRCSAEARVWCQLALVGYFMYIADGWYCAMFMAGMLLSHMDHLASLGRLPSILVRLQPHKTFMYYHMLVISIYLGGVPSENREIQQLAKNRGWYLLSFLKPQAVFDYKWFFLFWAAVLLMPCVRHLSWLRRFFETRVCQYLGRVSFALYLVHGPVLWTIGDRLYAVFGISSKAHLEHIPGWVGIIPVSKAGPVGLELSFLLANLFLLPLTLYIANVVTRVVDKPSVKFASWVYSKTLEKTAATRPKI